MDTQECRDSMLSDPLSDLKGRKIVAGMKQLKKAMVTGMAQKVFLAENADPALTEPIEAVCL